MINHKTRLFHSHKIHLLVLSGPFTDSNDRFRYSFIYFNDVKSLPFDTPEAIKRYPLRAEPPRIGHYRDYPLVFKPVFIVNLREFYCDRFAYGLLIIRLEDLMWKKKHNSTKSS